MYVLFLLLLSNKHPLWCWKVRFSALSFSSSYAVRSVWRQTQCPNYLCIPTLIRKCTDSLMCVIKPLFVVTLLHICHSVAENGGSVLWQHHWAAEDWTRVLPNGLLRQEVSFLPQGKAYQIQSHLVCPDTVMILLMRSAALLIQRETMSAAVACVGQRAGMLSWYWEWDKNQWISPHSAREWSWIHSYCSS